jgi:hypothetical protein
MSKAPQSPRDYLFVGCEIGHDWQSLGGRACPYTDRICSQAVMRCVRCGDYDYGESGGPGYMICAKNNFECEQL